MDHYKLMTEREWGWEIADGIITKFNRMKRDVQADDVDLLKMIAEALVEERERCLSIAGYHADCSLSASHSEDDGSYYACVAIAEDILNPKPVSALSQFIADEDQPF